MTEVGSIEVSQLHESPTNPRTVFDKEYLAELSASIKEKGIILPLLVRSKDGHMEIVSGACRFRAAKTAGLKSVPCIERALSDEEALEIQLIENLQRLDLHPLDEAVSYKRLKEFGYSMDQIASKVSKSPSYVHQRLSLNNLIEPIKKMFHAGTITNQHAHLVARLGPDQQKDCIETLKQGDSPRELADWIQRKFFLVLKDAAFDIRDAKLVPEAGSCMDCPKRTGFNKLLFPDVKEHDTCTDPDCFAGKEKAFIKLQVSAHPKATLLTVGRNYGQGWKPKGLLEWTPAGKEHCSDMREGVVVEKNASYDHGATIKLGQVVLFCANGKCKTHYPPKAKSDYDSATGGSKKAIKARKIELRRRALIFKELADKNFVVKGDDWRFALDHQVEHLSNESSKAICDAMGWEPGKSKYGGKDYGSTIEKNLEKLTPEGIDRWLFLLIVAEEELWFPNNVGVPKCSQLEGKAKTAGVSLDEISKLVKGKSKKVPVKPKAKTTAA